MFKNLLKITFISIFMSVFCLSSAFAQNYDPAKQNTPFELELPALKPKKPTPYQQPSFTYEKQDAFKLVVTVDEYPESDPDKSIYGIITLKVNPGYKATSKVTFIRDPYKIDRLNWAIRTGWNETIPFFSRISVFKKWLKPFYDPVYAHFYIKGLREYPEYPGQYHHWPRDDLEDYYLFVLRKIDSIAY